jgi:TRAP-type transport system periplasmic protein
MNLHRLAFALSTLTAFGASAPALAQADIQERTIRFGYFVTADHPVGIGARKFGEIVAAKSGGKIKVRDFPSSQLGSEMQQQTALIAGTQEMAAPGSPQLVSMVKEFGILDFPYIVSSLGEADALLDGPFGQALLDRLPEKGIMGLGYWENGFRHVTNSRRPIKRLEDLEGLKIRVQLNPVFVETFKAFKMNPVPLAFSELYTAMETRTVDAQENPLPLILTTKFYEVQKYVGLTGHVYGNNIILMSKKFWDKLSPTEQKIMRESMEEAKAYERKVSREILQKAIADLRAKGMQVDELPKSEIDRMHALAKPIIAKFSAEYDPTLVKLFNQEVQRVRK